MKDKTIKIIGIVVGILLIIVILYMLFYIIGFFKDNNFTNKGTNKDLTKNISKIDIDLKYTSLSIESCSKYRVDTDNEFIKVEIIDNTLRIKEKKHNPLTRKDTESITLCINKNSNLSELELDTGAGKVEIEDLNVEKAEFDLGVGSLTMENSKITDKFNLDGGAGSITINDSTLTDSDIDLGVGVLHLTASLDGNTKIDSGLGNSYLDIIGNKKDYTFVIDKGLGKVLIDNETFVSGTFGNGNKKIVLDTGTGNTTINFKNND